MRATTWPRAIAIVSLFTLAIPTVESQPVALQAHPVFIDNMDDDTINDSLWAVTYNGYGPTLDETNHRIEVTLPGDSFGDPS